MGRARLKLEPRSEQCTATSKRSEQRCLNPAIRGSTVCRMHGGSLPSVKDKAARNVAEAVADAKIAQFLSQNQIVPVENPLEALKELAGEIVMVKNWLRDQVTNLSHESTVQGDQISSVMQLYSNFLDKSDRTLTNIAKLNIDERLSHIQGAQATMMVKVLTEAIMKLVKDDDKRNEAKVIVGQLLQKYDS
jgi:hypothetical protein